MSEILQQVMVLESAAQVRNAEKLVRDWAVAHAGNYNTQARKALSGTDTHRCWQRNGVEIVVASPLVSHLKQCRLTRIRFQSPESPDSYRSIQTIYAVPDSDPPTSHFACITFIPDSFQGIEFPWDEAEAGVQSMERITRELQAAQSRNDQSTPDRPAISGLDDLLRDSSHVVVLTDEGRNNEDLRNVIQEYLTEFHQVQLTPAEQLVIARELPEEQVSVWLRAGIAFFQRNSNRVGHRMLMCETETEPARTFLKSHVQQGANDVTKVLRLNMMRILEGAVLSQFDLMKSHAPDTGKNKEVSSNTNHAASQRIAIFEDQLQVANETVRELRQQVNQLRFTGDSYDQSGVDAEGDDRDILDESKANRNTMVLDGITQPDRFSDLRFLTNSIKKLENYGKQRPTGAEILAAREAINFLAADWHENDGNIGLWASHFMQIPGWNYSNGDSEATMGRYGDKRSFSDQEYLRHVTITRHLTYK